MTTETPWYTSEPITVSGDSAGSNLVEKPSQLSPAEKLVISREIHGVSVRNRVADKFSARTYKLTPATVQPWEALPFARSRKQADFVVNNWKGKPGTLVLGDAAMLANLSNTPTKVPYVALGGPMLAITVGTSNHVPFPYRGANALAARYFGPATAVLWLSVADYTWMGGTPV